MEIPKPTEADKEFFRSVLPDNPEVEVKPMFGNLGAFVHGNMFAGLFGSAVGVRLDDAAREELEGIAGSGPFGPAERPMGGYTSLPEAWHAAPERAASWVERALSYVSTLPPKVKKARSAR
jgi:TfoX/Sxy family transcriptional regulator of competence genes